MVVDRVLENLNYIHHNGYSEQKNHHNKVIKIQSTNRKIADALEKAKNQTDVGTETYHDPRMFQRFCSCYPFGLINA